MTGLARKYKPYPAYKPSGVEWLGEIPAHWEAKRLKYLVEKVGSGKTPKGGAERYIDDGVMLLRSQNVRFGQLHLADVAYIDTDTDNEMAGSRVQEGDVLLNITGASLGRSCVARLGGIDANVNQHVCILRADQQLDSPEFLAYSVESRSLQDQIFNNENGVSRDALNFEQIKDLVFARPATKEQQAIAAFLDRETARIDALVSRKERLTELLQEKRTALITRAVTKGLDPNAPMKDSGVEWLGEIPAHWEAIRLKHLVSMRAGTGITSTEIEEIGEYPVFGGNGIRGYTSSFTHDGKHPLIGRQGALCGAINLASGKFWATEHAVVVDPGKRVSTDCLTYTLMAMSLNQYSQSAAQPGLNIEAIGNVLTPAPPLPEQRSIAAFLDRETAKIDDLIAKVREAIECLKELRTALISAAVTGRIDVREEAV